MSILVVNSLKNSAGSAPTLTIPTADGTDGQVLKSSNNAGNLIFAGAQLEAQNGTNITFPASAADDSVFVTDANGNLTATVVGTNPMNTPDNAHQGERLLDKYVFSGGTPVASVKLMVDPGYTTTDLNTIRSMRLVFRGVGTNTGVAWRPTVKFLIGYGTNKNNDFYTSGSGSNAYYFGAGTDGRIYQQTASISNNSNQETRITRTSVSRRSGGASGVDYFSATNTGYNDNLNSVNGLLSGEVHVFPASMPHMCAKMQYIDNDNTTNTYNETTYFANYGQSVSPDNSTGRHPMGLEISNTVNNPFGTGLIELYGTFKDGVVS